MPLLESSSSSPPTASMSVGITPWAKISRMRVPLSTRVLQIAPGSPPSMPMVLGMASVV